MQIIFALVFFLICSHYFLFGLFVIIAAHFKKRSHIIDNSTPSVSYIVAAYNEERIIQEKILNDLDLDYPKDKIEIIVVSDGSNDKTSEIVDSFAKDGVIGLHQSARMGKTAALNRAIEHSKNEILVFSDANSMFEKNTLRKLVRHFADSSFGGVCGRKSILKNNSRKASIGDHLYWIYESKLKEAESQIGSIPTADGEIFAIRRSLYKEVDQKIINDDMAITLNIIKQKKRVIYDPEAITKEQASITLKDDFNVKSRMVYGGLQIIMENMAMLNPIKSFFGFQFFVHKTLRYFMWFLLVLIYVSNYYCLSLNAFYKIFFILQTTFYIMAILGHVFDLLKIKNRIFYLPYYYCNVNLAACKGFLFFINQRSTVDIWKKATR